MNPKKIVIQGQFFDPVNDASTIIWILEKKLEKIKKQASKTRFLRDFYREFQFQIEWEEAYELLDFFEKHIGIEKTKKVWKKNNEAYDRKMKYLMQGWIKNVNKFLISDYLENLPMN